MSVIVFGNKILICIMPEGVVALIVLHRLVFSVEYWLMVNLVLIKCILAFS